MSFVAFHGADGDTLLEIVRSGVLRPRHGEVYLSANHETTYAHGADRRRRASFALELRIPMDSPTKKSFPPTRSSGTFRTSAMARDIDFQLLVQTAQALAKAHELDAIAPAAIEACIRDVLRERQLVEACEAGIITEEEAANALFARVTTWMLRSQGRAHSGLDDYSRFTEAGIRALFGHNARSLTRASS